MQNIKETLLNRFTAQADPEAFTEIIRRHAGLVYGACLRILQDEDKAADAAQETFFQMLKSAGQITGSVSGWLHRVATCRAIDRLRRDSVRKEHEQRYSQENPCRVEQWNQISPYVDEELDKLDDQTRDILMRHYFAGRTTRDISKEIGISQSTVSRRMEAGLDLLRQRLSKRGLIVAAAALGGLLMQNAAQAAPAALLTELGKMALVAGTAGVAASSAGAATVSAGKAATGGILAGVKAKMITAAVVVVVGTGSVVTYNHLSQSRSRTETPESLVSSEQSAKETAATTASGRTAQYGSNITYIEGQSEGQPVTTENKPQSTDDDDFDEWFDSIFAEDVPSDGQTAQPAGSGVARSGGMGMGGGMMGGGMMGAAEGEVYGGMIMVDQTPPDASDQPEDEEQ